MPTAPLAYSGDHHDGSYRVPLHYQPYDFVNQEFGTHTLGTGGGWAVTQPSQACARSAL